MRVAMFAGFLAGMLVAWSHGCGGGGSDAPAGQLQQVDVVATSTTSDTGPAGALLAFEDAWDPRTAATGVFGVVHDVSLVATADGSDPQVPWVSAITGRWGALAWPDVSGTGPNRFWSVHDNRLHFHAGGADNFALISGMTFSRRAPIVAEADFIVTAGGNGSFAGLALIAGEGDYREVAFRRNGVDYIKRVTPLRETVLGIARPGMNTFRIDYDPARGADAFRFYANGVLLGVEALDHEGASFVADPSVALYFAGEGSQPGSFIEGSVGRLRVWTGAPVPAVTKEAGNA